ncbi:Putative peptidase S9, prolyl oligopeptidase, catalytic domain, dipeptidylpeptidase IV [Septoria linicola]|uniref:dipeptidyl-peptidase IV n=1 Tax=Septoria linicola TaxID=215465 RepID=A0A9Q9B4Z7_9PEZI|nr:Putative peptidase S9, prolyl oligopeptidase, catalytic domain, dipeptidylpeptidase IV [Septoria linicola]
MALTKLVTIGALLFPLTAAIDPPRQPRQPLGNGDRRLTYNETTPTALNRATSQSVSWIAGEQDGQFVTVTNGSLTLENIVTGDSSVFVAADNVPEDYHEYWISPDQERVLWAVNYTKQYRYSYYADYLIQDVATGETTPLVADQVGDILYAEFAPTGGAIAFVRGNDLYIHNGSEISRITENGGPDVFNANPDWVYEEEIFGTRKTFWFSPDSEFIAFLSFNETGVGTFRIPYYMDNQEIAPPYPRELELRYPKVGTTNPTVQFNVLDLASKEYSEVPITAFSANDTVIGEVAWVTDEHSAVIYRAFNRVQDQDKHVLVDPVTKTAEVVRERDGTDGWLDNTLTISYIGAVQSNNSAPTYSNSSADSYYVDMSDESGWMHLYLHSTAGGEPVALTSGEWEVVAILKVDTTRNLIYYTSTEHHSTERHVYSVNYATREKKAIVDDSVDAYWSASFSEAGDYYILSYQGPDVPYQEVYATNSSEPLSTLVSNEVLVRNISALHLPNITYFELEHPEGFSLNVMQRLPPNFDPSKKYPVLFTPYGGPGAQEVSKRFQTLAWRAYIASDPELEYITYTIDNRGTGYKGRAFRSTVTRHLGRLEPQDQIWAAEQLTAQNSFIDAERVGMWGWSFGGYLTAKVLEADSDVFSFGLITAPVSDWRFYDSMYTERYMKTYEQNPEGYNETAVRKADGFKNARGGFGVMHGTGDDNVHYQNTAALVDLLVGEGVSPQKMEMVAFTDSDHSIVYNGASAWIYKYLTKRLWQEKERKTGLVEQTHQWLKKREVAVPEPVVV